MLCKSNENFFIIELILVELLFVGLNLKGSSGMRRVKEIKSTA